MFSTVTSVWAEGLVPTTNVERGVVLRRTLAGDASREYFLYVPSSAGDGAKIFVAVHGVSRNAEEHARRFAPLADQYGVVIVAPSFPADRFPDYQRLGRKGRGERSDLALNAIVCEVASLTGAEWRKLYLFGYSGGAQFVNRDTFAHPERVAKAVLGAPGWYTFPDGDLRYPEGVRASRSLPQLAFDPVRFLTIPMCVLVGERDDVRDAELRITPRIDLLQGVTRLERGRRWLSAMTDEARRHGLSTRYVFQTLPRSSHSFACSMRRGGMGKKAFEFLFANPRTGTAARDVTRVIRGCSGD